MIDRIKKNKKILTGLALFMVLALLLIAIHSWDEDSIKSMLKDKVTFVNLPNDDEEMLATIPKSAKLIANYSGRQNTIFFTYNGRIYCYDKAQKLSSDIPFDNGYEKIKDIYLSPAKSRIFVVLDMGARATNYVCDGQQLWVINTLNRQTRKLFEGFRVEKRKGCIVVGKADYCCNSKAPFEQRRWKCRNHYFDFTGKIIWCMDDYEIMEKDYNN